MQPNHIVELGDALAEAGDLSQALVQAVRGKVEEPTPEDAAIERLASLVRDRVEAAGERFDSLRSGGA